MEVVRLRKLELPLEEAALASLEACDEVLLYGETLTMRDAALKRLEVLLRAGEEPPFDVRGRLIFHAGPAPGAAGRPAGAIGPTTSARMDRFLPILFELGAVGTLGKGPRSVDARKVHAEYGTVYLAAIGGLGAFFGTKVTGVEPVAWEDLDAEGVHRVTLAGFPAVVAIDPTGGDCLRTRFEQNRQEPR